MFTPRQKIILANLYFCTLTGMAVMDALFHVSTALDFVYLFIAFLWHGLASSEERKKT